MDFRVGNYVLLTGKEGYIRYIGERIHHHGTWYGIELVIGNGHMSGSEHGKRYFFCKYNKGIFIRSSAIKAKLSNITNKNTNKNKSHKKRRSTRNKSSLKSPKSSLKSPKQKHKISRSISPLSRSEKNKSKGNILKSPRIYHNTHTNNNGEPSYSRSKSYANISGVKRKSKRKQKLNRNNSKSKFIGADGKLSTANAYSNCSSRLRLKNSKSTDFDHEKTSKSKLKPLKLKHNKSAYINSSKKKKRHKHKQDSNIKPSIILKHKKRLSNTQILKNSKNNYSKPLPKLKPSVSGHIISKSVGMDLNDNKNNMFDLEAILDSNNLNVYKKQNGKTNYKKFKTKSKPKREPKSKSNYKNGTIYKNGNVNVNKKDKPVMKFKQRNYNGFKNDCRKSRRNRSISPAKSKKYRVRELGIDKNKNKNIKNKKRSRSTNSLFSTRKRNGYDVDIFSDGSDDKDLRWKCEKCDRMNNCDFKFCPNCGGKRPLHTMKKVEINLDKEELKQGSDSDEMAESDDYNDSDNDSDQLYKYIEDEQKQMECILDEMKFEDNRKMKEIQIERDELDGLKKEDFIKTLDDINTDINGDNNNNNMYDKPPMISVVSPKEKVKKLEVIKNWILSPKTILSPKIKYETNENYDNTMKTMGINNKYNNNAAEDSVSMSDISYAYSIGGRDNSDRLMNIKITDNYKQTLDLIPDTPRSTIDEYNDNQSPKCNTLKFNEYIYTGNDQQNNSLNNNHNGNSEILNGNNQNRTQRKHRKKKPKSVRKKKKSKKKKKLQSKYQLDSNDENI